jgi:hypothetical protein
MFSSIPFSISERIFIMKETVLYFSPKKTPQTAALKGLLIRMGIRIRNIAPEQVQEQVGALAGAAGFEKSGAASTADPEALEKLQEEMLVLCNFSEARLDALLQGMRRSGIRIALKAMLTESNAGWTFLQLYEELLKEHAIMTNAAPFSSKEQ